MLMSRILTSIVVLPLLFAAIIWLPPVDFAMLTGAAILIGAWEWSQLAGIQKKFSRILYVLIIFIGLFSSIFIPVFAILLIALFALVWMLIAILSYQREGLGAGFQLKIVRGVIGLIVLVATWVSIVALKSHPLFGPNWLILVLLIVVGADVGAYFAGRFCGKRLLCSRVSPKKTWEGFFGGLFLSTLTAVIGGLFFSLPIMQYLCLILLSVITALFSIVGDLGESLLKRIAGVKDSGAIFPGHGGMLDRLDSISAATIVFVFGVLLCNPSLF